MITNNRSVITYYLLQDELKIGDKFSVGAYKFEVIKELGHGSMGTVALVKEIKPQKYYAMKTPRFSWISDDDYNIKSLEKESYALLNIQLHESISNIIMVVKVNNLTRIFTEYVDGKHLDNFIPNLYELDKEKFWKVILDISIQIANGINHIHESNFLHRDLKPSNILYTNDKHGNLILKIIDFGIADLIQKQINPNSRSTEIFNNLDSAAGTTGYASPEQIGLINDSNSGRNTDIFSYGIILYQIITGRLPFTYIHVSNQSFAIKTTDGENKNISDIDLYNYLLRSIPICRSQWPHKIISLITKCIQYEPQDRWKKEKEEKEFRYFKTIQEELEKIYLEMVGNEYINNSKRDELDPYSKSLYYSLRGASLSLFGDYQRSLSYCNKAIDMQPNDASVFVNKGAVLILMGQFDDAIINFDKALEKDTRHPEAWYNKGYVLDEMGRYNEALYCYKKSLETDIEDPDKWYNLGISYSRLRKFNEALYCYDEALKLRSIFAKALGNKGASLVELGQYKEAETIILEALDLDPNDAKYWYNLGCAYERQGSNDKADHCFKKYNELK